MKNSQRYVRLALLLACMCVSATAYADVKVKRRTTMGAGQTFDQTVYIKGKRQRTERAELPVANVEQCDLRRSLEINSASKTYKVNSWQDGADAPQATPAGAQQAGATRRGGVVTTTMTSRDTGERRKIFGYTARRVITTMVTESSPDACTPVKSKMETDAWYIDAEFDLECSTERYRNYRPVSAKPDCSDRYEMKTVGAAQTGYPVYSKTTMYGENGEVAHTFTDEVIELSQATLDAALFDVPADYREVKDSAEMYAQMAAASAAAANSGAAPDENGNAADGLGASVAQPPQAAAPVGPKKEGVVRLGLAAVKVGSVADGMNAANLSAAVRNTLAEYLKSSTVELVQLEARLPSEIESEARQKECDFVIYATASHKKGGGGFGKMFGKSAGLLGGVVPAAGIAGGNAAAAAHVGTSAVYTAAAMSADVKAKDELTLEVRLQAPGTAAPAVSKQLKAKAKSDGDDILSPLVEQAAQAIMDTARR